MAAVMGAVLGLAIGAGGALAGVVGLITWADRRAAARMRAERPAATRSALMDRTEAQA